MPILTQTPASNLRQMCINPRGYAYFWGSHQRTVRRISANGHVSRIDVDQTVGLAKLFKVVGTRRVVENRARKPHIYADFHTSDKG